MEIGRPLQFEHTVPVRGWRAWTVVETAAGIRLASPLYSQLWLPGEPAVAACKRDEDSFARPVAEHEVGSSVCACGFHAVRDPVDAFSYLRGRDDPGTIGRILGEVALWGDVLAGEAGWRATNAYPLRLYTADGELAEALAPYGVAVRSAGCASASATSSRAASVGSSTSSSSAARMRWSSTNASG
jgi:hypothetical protein